jgi:CRISPR-associated protein Cmr2
MMTTQHFHFSLAPVQGFIAQARRTRDFWAGSFILSWLSAVAMQAVNKQDGCEIIFPEPDKDYLLWLEGGKNNNPPEHGGVPNRFKACVNEKFKPEDVVESVNKAWQALANKVYEGDLNAIGNEKTKEIWDKQVRDYWDMSWLITDEPDPKDEDARKRRDDELKINSPLDMRKSWRSYLPPEQAGVKCMMMDGWQELSGVDRANDKKSSKEDKTLLEDFWLTVRGNEKVKGMKTDLREGEYLCAIAFIKRRFPRYFDENLVAVMPNGWTLKGWEVKAGRPSVTYMAAVHWLEQVLKIAENDAKVSYQLRVFRYKAYRLTKSHNERDNQIHCLKPFTKHRKWLSLDGNVFFESALENKNIYPDQEQKKQVNQKQPAEDVLNELKSLQKLLPDTIKPATPFYAVLMMDGDGLGKQMSDSGKQTTISRGLKDFTGSVPALVQKHDGFLIYAGGDDVLAVLPLEDALTCALAIRQKYECVFADLNLGKAKEEQVFTSISAAVVFAHIQMPLTKVLKEAHDLLDKVAKEEYGRDALAVRVWKSGNQVLQWARPWDKAIENKQLVLERLADDFAGYDQDGQLSNKFLYKIRERFALLNPPPDKNNKTPAPKKAVLDTQQGIDLMAAEYFSSGLCENIEPASEKMNHAKKVVGPLLEQCRPVYRKLDKSNVVTWETNNDVLVDAALLVRFLAQKGVNP